MCTIVFHCSVDLSASYFSLLSNIVFLQHFPATHVAHFTFFALVLCVVALCSMPFQYRLPPVVSPYLVLYDFLSVELVQHATPLLLIVYLYLLF